MPCLNRALMPGFNRAAKVTPNLVKKPLAVAERHYDELHRECETLKAFLSGGSEIPQCLHSRIASRIHRLRRMAARGSTPLQMKKLRILTLVVRAHLKLSQTRCIEAEAAFLTARALA